MEHKKLMRIKDNLTKFLILFILMIICLNYTHNQSEAIGELSKQVKQLESQIKDLNADVNICTNDALEALKVSSINSERSLDIQDTMDWQTTQTNIRIDKLRTEFDDVSAQRLFITEDE